LERRTALEEPRALRQRTGFGKGGAAPGYWRVLAARQGRRKDRRKRKTRHSGGRAGGGSRRHLSGWRAACRARGFAARSLRAPPRRQRRTAVGIGPEVGAAGIPAEARPAAGGVPAGGRKRPGSSEVVRGGGLVARRVSCERRRKHQERGGTKSRAGRTGKTRTTGNEKLRRNDRRARRRHPRARSKRGVRANRRRIGGSHCGRNTEDCPGCAVECSRGFLRSAPPANNAGGIPRIAPCYRNPRAVWHELRRAGLQDSVAFDGKHAHGGRPPASEQIHLRRARYLVRQVPALSAVAARGHNRL